MTTHLKTLIFLLGLIGGIAVGEKSPYATEIIIFSVVTLLVEGVVYFWSKRKGMSSYVALTLITLSLGVIIGAVRMQFVAESARFICESVCKVEVAVERKGDAKDTYQTFDVQVDEETLLVRVRAPLYPEYKVGDRLELSGKITVPENFVPHGEKKSFDYVSYLEINRVGSESYYPKITILDPAPHTLKQRLQVFHGQLVARIMEYVSEPASYLASGMLLGVSSFSSELLETFRVTGLSHIVVLSGFNITILIVFVLILLRPLPVSVRVVVASLVVVIFVTMVGGGSSLVRASGMAFISLLALLFGRGYVASQALLISLIAILLYSPLSLFYDASLHLSFLATAGIVYGCQSLEEIFSKWLSRGASQLLAATIAAYLSTLPYILYTFGTFSLYGVMSNLLVLPLVPLTMSFTALTLLMSFLHPVPAILLGVIAGGLGDVIIFFARTIEGLPMSSSLVSISATMMVALYIVVIIFFVFLRTREKNETTETKDGDLVSPIMRF
jgi:competence protein ComEC